MIIFCIFIQEISLATSSKSPPTISKRNLVPFLGRILPHCLRSSLTRSMSSDSAFVDNHFSFDPFFWLFFLLPPAPRSPADFFPLLFDVFFVARFDLAFFFASRSSRNLRTRSLRSFTELLCALLSCFAALRFKALLDLSVSLRLIAFCFR